MIIIIMVKMARKRTNRYTLYSNETQSFMLNVDKFLIDKYGIIKPHWEGQLDLLASNYELFIMAKNKVKEDGLMVVNRFGNLDKHPLLAQIKDSNIQCCKLINEFGLSPKADSKIKSESNDDADYLDSLING